jgi:hypothetical protein
VPGVEALLPRFRGAHTQVLGISVDSVYCHANWGRDLGGVSFPLLADFEPKGGVAHSYGLYLEKAGITDRATVIIDKDGVVRYAESVTPDGKRDPAALATECEQIDSKFGAGLAEVSTPPGIPAGTQLYVKSNCGFSRAVLLARDNLHLQGSLPHRNISDDAAARDALVKITAKDQAPCLVHGSQVIQESAEIIRFMTGMATDL